MEANEACPNCSYPVRHHTEAYGLGGNIDVYWCTECGWGCRVMPPMPDVDPWQDLNTIGRNVNAYGWQPIYQPPLDDRMDIDAFIDAFIEGLL